MNRRLVALLALLVALLVVLPVGAHSPGIIDEISEVPTPKISWGIYGEFETGEEVYVVGLTYDEPFALPFEMLVPERPALEDHRPAYAVVGPGLPAPTAEEAELLPRDLPAGAGAYVELNADPERHVIFESVMRRTYWSSGPVALSLEAGHYEVWVWSPGGTTGDFALGFGVEEDFGPGSCATLYADWGDYAY